MQSIRDDILSRTHFKFIGMRVPVVTRYGEFSEETSTRKAADRGWATRPARYTLIVSEHNVPPGPFSFIIASPRVGVARKFVRILDLRTTWCI